MTINELISLIEGKTGFGAKKSGRVYSLRCPAHDDTTPSLSVSEGDDGKILVNCFSGCSYENICASLGIEITSLFPTKLGDEHGSTRQRTEYPYRDENGLTLFSKIRVEPGFKGKTKSFYWERINEKGEIIKNIDGCRKILYRLPEVLKAVQEGKTIFLVEGEKDADKLVQYGLVTTTAPESLKWPDNFTGVLQNCDVVLLYDMDKTGIERRDLLCKSLHGKVKRLRVIDLPGLEYQESHGKDVSDWLAEGNTISRLLEILTSTTDYSPTASKSKIRAVTLEEFLKMELPKREMILAPFFPSQGLCLLYAQRGVGKTHVALGIGYAIATGGSFLKWKAPKPRKVLYIDGEMPAGAMQERLQRISLKEDLKLPDPSYLQLITPDLQDNAMPDLSIKEERDVLEDLILDSDLIIIDNISTLFRSVDENDAESWQPVQDWALELRRKGKSVLFVHHAGKKGLQRGTSKREDVLDCVIKLVQPPGYSADQGAAFEVIFEKTRHFTGNDAAPFQVRLKEEEDGLWRWDVGELTIDPKVEKVAQALKEGLTIGQTMNRTGLSKSQVETRKKKAKEQGLI